MNPQQPWQSPPPAHSSGRHNPSRRSATDDSGSTPGTQPGQRPIGDCPLPRHCPATERLHPRREKPVQPGEANRALTVRKKGSAVPLESSAETGIISFSEKTGRKAAGGSVPADVVAVGKRPGKTLGKVVLPALRPVPQLRDTCGLQTTGLEPGIAHPRHRFQAIAQLPDVELLRTACPQRLQPAAAELPEHRMHTDHIARQSPIPQHPHLRGDEILQGDDQAESQHRPISAHNSVGQLEQPVRAGSLTVTEAGPKTRQHGQGRDTDNVVQQTHPRDLDMINNVSARHTITPIRHCCCAPALLPDRSTTAVLRPVSHAGQNAAS